MHQLIHAAQYDVECVKIFPLVTPLGQQKALFQVCKDKVGSRGFSRDVH